MFLELRRLNITRFVLGIYSDDLGIISAGFNCIIREISTDLGSMLGFVFKTAKDVESSATMDFIGYEICTAGQRMTICAKVSICTRLATFLTQFVKAPTAQFEEVETFMGLWGQAARVCIL